MTAAGPVRRTSGTQSVYEVLRSRILKLELRPDERLYEDKISTEFAVSRTPVREALRLLMMEELVYQRPTGGVVVSPLNPDEMYDIYCLRAQTEALLVRNAVERGTDEEMKILASLISKSRLLVDFPDQLTDLGREFHRQIVEMARNQAAAAAMRYLQGHLDRYRALTNQQFSRRPEVVDEHEAICNALIERNHDAAEAAVREHAMSGYAAAMQALDKMGIASTLKHQP
jgi:DNA-binding GntR family transcriptional regulator